MELITRRWVPVRSVPNRITGGLFYTRLEQIGDWTMTQTTIGGSVATIRQGIETFLQNRIDDSPFLIERWRPILETQINVQPGTDDEVVSYDDNGNPNAWEADGEKWANHRWPRDAATQPHYRDRPLTYSPSERVTRIGTTWFDWEQQQSIAVAFDIDAIAGHSSTTVTNTTEQLAVVLEQARSLPYTTIVRSKSGNGYHIYVFFDPSDRPQTANHKEHATAAKRVLQKMKTDSGFPFSDYIDVFGGNFWLWSNEIGPHGFELVQDATRLLTASELPPVPEPEPIVPTVPAENRTNEQDILVLVLSMLQIQAKEGERDGSRRLFALACRGVEADYSDSDIIKAVRQYEQWQPFPKSYTDSEIVQRIRHAELKVKRGSRRKIRLGLDTSRVVAETIKALAANDVYQNESSVLTRITYEPEPLLLGEDSKDNGCPRIAPYKKTLMYELLPSVAEFGSLAKGKWTPCLPPNDLRANIFDRADYPDVKLLKGVLNRPIILPNGDIWSHNGYHAESGYYLHDVGDYPEPMTNAEALAWFDAILCDFPFALNAHKSVWLSGLLTLLALHLIDGNMPCHAVEGNRSRIGKGLLSDLWILIHLGRRASRYNFAGEHKGEELSKFLVSIAMSGQQYVLFDNVKDRFGGPTIEAALTAGRIAGRVLGLSKDVDLPLNIFWALTVNGGKYSRDMMGRVVPIMLDTSDPNPESRSDFIHDDLIGYVQEHRPQLLMAGLSILRNYIKAGRPLPKDFEPLGGFPEWSRLIWGAIRYAIDPANNYPGIDTGWDNPELARQAFVKDFDSPDTETVNQLVAAWAFTEPVSVREATQRIYADGSPLAALRELIDRHKGRDSAASTLGRLLASARGVPVNGKRFERSNRVNNPKWWLQ